MSITLPGYARRMAFSGLALLMIGCAADGRNGDYGRNSDTDSPDVEYLELGSDAEAVETDRPGSASDARVGGRDGIVVFLGTSLTAGYGLTPEQAYPALLQQRIDRAGLPFRIVNAGVSGETSAGALRRVDWLLQQPFDVLVIETGSNDMLRGTEPSTTEANIQEIIDRVRQRRPDARIVLAGMLALPNLGRDYGERFEAIYPRIAERNDLTLIPFLLEGVAGERGLNQADQVHPNAEGQRIIAGTVWETLEPVLREEAGRS